MGLIPKKMVMLNFHMSNGEKITEYCTNFTVRESGDNIEYFRLHGTDDRRIPFIKVSSIIAITTKIVWRFKK